MIDRRDAQDEKPIGELVSDLVGQVGDLVSTQIQMARHEITQEMKKSGRAGGMLGAAAVLGYLALLLVAFAAAWGLSDLADIPAGWSFLIVGALLGVVAAVVFGRGRRELREVDLVPERTIETLKEDAEWIRERKS